MFEFYNCNKKIPEYRYLEMNDILLNDYIYRHGIDEYEKKRKILEGEGFEHWKSMILNDPDYNIILYIDNNKIIGFICYIFLDEKLLLSEVQIRYECHGKDYLRKMLKKLIEINENKYIKTVIGAINTNNKKSQDVFTHIGMVNTDKNLFEISFEDLKKWINKKTRTI